MANQNNILFYTESDSTLNPQSIQQDVNQIKEKKSLPVNLMDILKAKTMS